MQILYSDQSLKKETLERLKDQWEKNYRGFDNAYRTAILEQGLKFQQLQTSQKDMDFLEQQKFLRDKLMAMYKTNPTILGITENANRAVSEAAEYNFTKRCLRPKMQRLVEYLNEFLIPLFDPNGKEGIFIDFVDPVKEDRTQEIHQYSVAVDKWMLKNEIRDRENLPALEGGDVIYQPINLQPMGTAPIYPSQPSNIKPEGPNTNVPAEPNMNPDGSIGQPNESNDGKIVGWQVLRITQEAKDKAFAKRFEDQINKMRNRNIRIKQLRKEFLEQIQKLVKVHIMKKYNNKKKKYDDVKLTSTKEKFTQELLKNSKDLEDKLIQSVITNIYVPQQKEIIDNINSKGLKYAIRKSASDFLFNEKWEEKIFNLLNPLFKDVILKQGQEGMDLVGGFSYSFSDDASNYINKTAALSAKSVTETIRGKIENTLADGIAKKESKIDLIARMVSAYHKLEEIQPKQIAEIEVSRMTNYALMDAYKQSGIVKGKQWLINPSGKTCSFCNQAAIDFNKRLLDDVLVKKGETFTGSDGRTMKIDYDDIITPPLHNGCRCFTAPVLEELKQVKIEKKKSDKPDKKEDLEDLKDKNIRKAELILEQIDKELDGTPKEE